MAQQEKSNRWHEQLEAKKSPAVQQSKKKASLLAEVQFSVLREGAQEIPTWYHEGSDENGCVRFAFAFCV